MTALLDAVGIDAGYDGARCVREVDLAVHEGEVVALLGPNGAGKTTLLRCLATVLAPSAGSVHVDGLDVACPEQRTEVRRRLGYLPQEVSFAPNARVFDVVDYVGIVKEHRDARRRHADVFRVLDEVGLRDRAGDKVKTLSGGMRQRLGIAQAEVNYPDLLILDEPAAALDPMGRRDVLEVMEKLRKYTTIFYSTHILDDVQRVSDRVAILNHGRLVAEAPIEELLNGNGSAPVYSVTIKGDASQAQKRVAGQAWVQALTAEAKDGLTTWQVSVNEEEAAEDQMLCLILEDRNLRVKSFGRKTHNLEEVFVSMVGEEKSK